MRRTWLAGAVVLVAGVVLVVRPFVAAKRDYPDGVPSPAAVERADTVALVRARPVCFGHLAADQLSEQARFSIDVARGRVAGRLRLSLEAADGSGYSFARDVPPGSPSGAVAVLLTPPPRPTAVRVCIENHGTVPVELLASTDRARSRSVVGASATVPGRSVWFSFWEVTPRSIAERLPQTVERMTVFRPAYVTTGVLWVLLALLLLLAPALLLWACWRSGTEDAPDDGLDVNAVRSRRQRWLG